MDLPAVPTFIFLLAHTITTRKNKELLIIGRHQQQFKKMVQQQIQDRIGPGDTPQLSGSNQCIDLIVAVHDEEEPLHVVNFLDMETKVGGILYEK